jgi:hypothetical protein
MVILLQHQFSSTSTAIYFQHSNSFFKSVSNQEINPPFSLLLEMMYPNSLAAYCIQTKWDDAGAAKLFRLTSSVVVNRNDLQWT